MSEMSEVNCEAPSRETVKQGGPARDTHTARPGEGPHCLIRASEGGKQTREQERP